MMKKRVLAGLFMAVLLGTFGCKKSDGPSPQLQNEETLLRDSTYYYSILLSLWTDVLPQPQVSGDRFDLQAYTGKFETAEEVLVDLRRYAADDRFSFVDRTGTVSEEIQQGVYKETGATPIYLSSSERTTNADMYIKLVQRGSPAEEAGLKRGMRVLRINGEERIDYQTDQANSFRNFQKFFSDEPLELVVQEPGSERARTITVTGSSYQLNPILNARVLTHGNKKVGYIAYTSFVNVLNSAGEPNEYYTELINVFQEFEQAGIAELVVDLRYNGGGAANSAELLANLIVPSASGQNLMYAYKINTHLQDEGFSDDANPIAPFRPVNFSKPNGLDLKRVYFLATESSASASELVMNVLEPYMDTQIITVNGTGTYGKPVGFFGHPVVDGYADLYITSFQMLNSSGFGDYFDGLRGEKVDAVDGFLNQLGDENESLFAEALYHISQGGYRSARVARSANSPNKEPLLHRVKGPAIKSYRSNMYRFDPHLVSELRDK
ncbi:MAG: S41 family peptidase [Sphingobacterium sp.]